MNGPRRLRDDSAFFEATGVDLAAESEVLMTHDLPRLKRRVMGAVARGAAPRLSPTRGGPGLGHVVALLAVGGAIVGALASGRGEPAGAAVQAERSLDAMQQESAVKAVINIDFGGEALVATAESPAPEATRGRAGREVATTIWEE
ncbi:MAG: hypothetical protein CVU56_20030, partial [Deltaproteobacteria bacterium HGW-Deltaproteobacteria-14]